MSKTKTKKVSKSKTQAMEAVDLLSKMTDEQKQLLLDKFGNNLIKVSNQQPYSHYNTLLLLQQMEMRGSVYTMLGGYKDWINNDRRVKKGEMGNYIYRPIVSKSEIKDKKDEVKGAFLSPIWDISQTEEVNDSNGDQEV